MDNEYIVVAERLFADPDDKVTKHECLFGPFENRGRATECLMLLASHGGTTGVTIRAATADEVKALKQA